MFTHRLADRRPAISSARRFGPRLAAWSLVLFCASPSSAGAQAFSNVNPNNVTADVVANAGATAANKVTYLECEQINVAPGFAGDPIAFFEFWVANGGTATASARPTVFFWDATGAGGGPGTLLNYSQGSLISLPATASTGEIAEVFGSSATPAFTVPANGTFWAGVAFDSGGGTITAAKLNQIGQIAVGPPDVGTSPDEIWQTNTVIAGGNAAAYAINNPAGTVFSSPFGGAPVANFGWAFSVPGPNALTVLALGGSPLLALLRRRRKS